MSNLNINHAHLAIILPAKSRSDVMFCLQSYGTYLSCDRINTQLIYKIEIAQEVARRITKPQSTFSRFESHWLLFFIIFFLYFFLEGGGGGGRSDFIILFMSYFFSFYLFIFLLFFYFLFL